MRCPVIRDDVGKLVALVLFLCAGLVGHYDVLPAAVQPYQDWIEFGGFIGTMVQAFRMQPNERRRRRVKPDVKVRPNTGD